MQLENVRNAETRNRIATYTRRKADADSIGAQVAAVYAVILRELPAFDD